MGWFSTIKIVIGIVPVIIDAVKAIEAAIPGSGLGSEKLQAVKEIMAMVLDKADDWTDNFETLWGYIEPMVGILVGLFNKTGAFSK